MKMHLDLSSLFQYFHLSSFLIFHIPPFLPFLLIVHCVQIQLSNLYAKVSHQMLLKCGFPEEPRWRTEMVSLEQSDGWKEDRRKRKEGADFIREKWKIIEIIKWKEEQRRWREEQKKRWCRTWCNQMNEWMFQINSQNPWMALNFRRFFSCSSIILEGSENSVNSLPHHLWWHFGHSHSSGVKYCSFLKLLQSLTHPQGIFGLWFWQ